MVALANVKLPSFFRTQSLLKSVALAGNALTNNLRAARVSNGADKPAKWQMENAAFHVHFDLDSGNFTIWRRNEMPIWQKALVSVSTAKGRRSSSETDYARCVKVSKFNDNSGRGQQLIAQCIDRRHELDLEIRVYIFDERNEIEIETICKNVSKEDFIISGIEPFRADDGRSPRRANENAVFHSVTLGAGKTISSGRVVPFCGEPISHSYSI